MRIVLTLFAFALSLGLTTIVPSFADFDNDLSYAPTTIAYKW